jgi:protein-S-isoprenylcysteine O-methyltransferase Ste14
MINFLKHLQAILLLPFMVIVVVPVIILSRTNSLNLGWSLPFPANLLPFALGATLIALGLVLMVKTITLFAIVGQGTLAPWTPTRRLVVRGVYRHVRNPMISGVLCILLGEAVICGSLALLYWFGFFVLLNAIYIPLFEEPQLMQRFGEDYILYKQNVPRWLPRWTAWQPPLMNKRITHDKIEPSNDHA